MFERVCGGSLYSVERSVPGIDKRGNVGNRLQQGGGNLPSKAEGVGNLSRFGRTWGSAGPPLLPLLTDFCRETGMWALFSGRLVPGLDTSVLF